MKTALNQGFPQRFAESRWRCPAAQELRSAHLASAQTPRSRYRCARKIARPRSAADRLARKPGGPRSPGRCLHRSDNRFHKLHLRFRPPMMLHRPLLALAARLPTGRASTASLAGAASPRQALEAYGEIRHSQQGGRAHIPSYRQTKQEGVAHRVHRLWDKSENPGCGLVGVCRRGTEGVQDELNRNVKLRKR